MTGMLELDDLQCPLLPKPFYESIILWKASHLHLLEFYNSQCVKQTVLLTSYPLAKDMYQNFLHLKVTSWLDEHGHAMCPTIMYPCPETSSSPSGALPAVSSYTGLAWGKLSPSTHPAADVELPLFSALYLRAAPQATTSPKFKGLFLLDSSLHME